MEGFLHSPGLLVRASADGSVFGLSRGQGVQSLVLEGTRATHYYELSNAGHVVPGYGGAMDVVDSLMVAGPVAYFLIPAMI